MIRERRSCYAAKWGWYGVDMIDLQLVELLRRNARLSFAELARQVGLSAPAVHERVGKLESSGVILSYRAEVAPNALGLGVTALVGVAQSAASDTDELVHCLHEMPEVESCYFLTGEHSWLLKVRVTDMAELERLVARLGRTPGIAQTRTNIALSTKWENRPRPAPGRAREPEPEPES